MNSGTKSKLRKNKVVLERLISETISGEMNWTYLGDTMSEFGKKSIFISFFNVIGAKNIIIEMDMYMVKNRNNVSIYMQNSKTKDKIDLKDIRFSGKILDLSIEILRSVRDYSDDEDFIKIHDILMDKY